MTDRQVFLERTARSIAELQPNVTGLAETVMFLDVLGYTNKMAADHGFQDLADLARHALEFAGYYDTNFDTPVPPTLPIPGITRRTAEAFSVAYPWVIPYAVLLIFGVSLFLAEILPLDLTTAFIIGVYTGLLISGGMSSFGRLFSFYDGQSNPSEVRRLLTRFYALLVVILVAVSSALYGIGYFEKIPLHLVNISVVSAIALSILMASYMIIYNRRKIRVIIYSYSAGLTALLTVYFLTANLDPDVVTRYFSALGAALAVMSVPAIYYHYTIFRGKDQSKKNAKDNPAFYAPVSAIKNTLKSKFRVQFWEISPYFIYGVLFFCILFGDRIISWIYNPDHYVDGVHFPMLFNTAYHVGADSALMVLFPSLIIQYAMLAPLHTEIYNLSLVSKITETRKIQQFLNGCYKKMMIITILATIVLAVIMILFEPVILPALRGSTPSARIFDVAVISNVLMAIFAVNATFLIFMSKIKSVCVIGVIGVLFVGGIGSLLGSFGFENIIYAYLGETTILATTSYAVVRQNLKRATSIHFAKYV